VQTRDSFCSEPHGESPLVTASRSVGDFHGLRREFDDRVTFDESGGLRWYGGARVRSSGWDWPGPALTDGFRTLISLDGAGSVQVVRRWRRVDRFDG
jgi:hypothetical protein